jgi:APA family basic amino acid/polyamine antiporter
MASTPVPASERALAPKLGAFDATLIVMGGVVGSGIFATPSVVAARAGAPLAIVGAWALGGLIALVGAFVFAELAQRRPASGGLYGYMRDAYHPVIGFSYGWTALLISQSGGIAAAAITFGNYVGPALWHTSPVVCGAAAIIVLTAINCLGVREGGNVQNVLMLLKIGIVLAIILAGVVAAPVASTLAGTVTAAGFGAAMIPVLFAYDGFQTAGFVDGELKDPKRTMSRGLVFGISLVVVLYLGIVLGGLRVLGSSGLAATATPASEIMARAFGTFGQRLIVIGVAISTLGYLSNSMLASPRIYYAMARDGLFFKAVAHVSRRTRVPTVAILLQGAFGLIIALSGRYDQILNYVIAVDFVFMALAAGAVVIFRRRSVAAHDEGMRVPFHPWSTGFFFFASVAVVVNTLLVYPVETLIGLGILALAAPVYFLWKRTSPERA